jgi:hypothetical protein
MSRGLTVVAILSILLPMHAEDWTSLHREDEERWAKKTGISALEIHRLWRASSHFAEEEDDDSRIAVVDVTSLVDENQILFVTAAGEPRCVTLTVFSKASGFTKVWSADSTPDGHGFCDNLGLEVRVAAKSRRIEVIVPLELHSPNASHADVAHYLYNWSGRSFLAGENWLTLEYARR